MLYPQRNKHRQYIDLSGFWDFRFDYEDKGFDSNWKDGFDQSVPIAVPASWNDQFAENRDFLGPSWYQVRFNKIWDKDNKKIALRFGSVNYISDIWLNGRFIYHHEGGHLAFEFEITEFILEEENLLVVRVDGRLAEDHVPPKGRPLRNYPETNYDFYPFCGIHRPVILYAVPNSGIKDLSVITSIRDTSGILDIQLETRKLIPATVRYSVKGFETNLVKEFKIEQEMQNVTLEVENAQFWSIDSPNLYNLNVELIHDNAIIDSYSLKIGIRTIEVKNDKLLLNGKPIYLKGFGRHEDFPITGRGYVPAIVIKDYSLMEWIGANSFRTSHYPYSEQMMDLADRLGFLVIDEIPAVGLTFSRNVIERELELCTQYIQELIARDKNHPSVIMWSLANEPHSSIKSKEFFKNLYEKTKELDNTRPITIVNMMLYDNYHKPILLSEFGADTIPGWHSQPPEMFSEEYQTEFVKKYIEVCRSKHYIVGEHVWNLCDFKTSQGITRMGGMNYKGVFTRDRRPKMVAHYLRNLWKETR
ncbi:MAG: glycoside hydrolase family 2 TIM barrel-domain containing protein [Promethearchaeota archaeon]|jgi:beta-glucuronidase